MLSNLTEKAKASQSGFESLVSKIPGYAGYKNKEQRREADKLLRLHVARQYEQQLKHLGEVQYAFTSAGRLANIVNLERAATKLQLLIDRIKTASYGYAGLFDAVKVNEAILDKMYEFDESMLQGAAELSEVLNKLQAATDAEAPVAMETKDLLAKLDALNEAFSRRQDLILEQ